MDIINYDKDTNQLAVVDPKTKTVIPVGFGDGQSPSSGGPVTGGVTTDVTNTFTKPQKLDITETADQLTDQDILNKKLALEVLQANANTFTKRQKLGISETLNQLENTDILNKKLVQDAINNRNNAEGTFTKRQKLNISEAATALDNKDIINKGHVEELLNGRLLTKLSSEPQNAAALASANSLYYWEVVGSGGDVKNGGLAWKNADGTAFSIKSSGSPAAAASLSVEDTNKSQFIFLSSMIAAFDTINQDGNVKFIDESGILQTMNLEQLKLKTKEVFNKIPH